MRGEARAGRPWCKTLTHLASALAGNPLEHVARLTGVRESDIHVVVRDTSPFGTRRFVLWNPPLLSHNRSDRRR